MTLQKSAPSWRHDPANWHHPTRTHFCEYEGEDRQGYETWSYGDPTPSGEYECTCDGGATHSVSDADDCEAAVALACNVPLDIPEPCGVPAPGGAQCWPVEDESELWSCYCSDGAPLNEQTGATCDDALYEACAERSCESRAGDCSKLEGEIGYECSCADGSKATWPETRTCAAALGECTPLCTTSAGSCALRYSGFQCMCASADGDAATSVSVSNDVAFGLCGLAIREGCGVPAAGESCTEDEDWGSSVTCVADGSGAWDCTCEPGNPPAGEEQSNEANGEGGSPEVAGVGSVAGPVVTAPVPEPPAGALEKAMSCSDALWGSECD